MGKRKSASSPCHTGTRKRARQLPRTLPTLDTENHSLPGKAFLPVYVTSACGNGHSSSFLSLKRSVCQGPYMLRWWVQMTAYAA